MIREISGYRGPTFQVYAKFRAWMSVLVSGTVVLVSASALPTVASAQSSAAVAPSLVLDGVTIVDVEDGKLVSNQRVVIDGNRIQAVGSAHTITLPKGTQVVDASGKYLMPGLWDMHISPARLNHLYYPRLLAYGITGIRNAGAPVPLDTLRLWRREILAGTRIGPPRQLLAPRLWEWPDRKAPCYRSDVLGISKENEYIYVCVEGAAHARHLVDSLKAAGVDMITVTGATPDTYFALLAEARRLGLPFGGKDGGGDFLSESDSGARVIDDLPKELAAFCADSSAASVERCQPVAERLRHNGTWVTVQGYVRWAENNLSGMPSSEEAGVGYPLHIIQRVDLPILAMSYVRADYPWEGNLPGSTLHETLADLVARGLTPLTALRSATLNPATFLRSTDSLGTVAAGKLADLVLLDANPLADITHTTKIRAVIANGRYFDRAALDQLLVDVQAKAEQEP